MDQDMRNNGTPEYRAFQTKMIIVSAILLVLSIGGVSYIFTDIEETQDAEKSDWSLTDHN